MKSVADVVFDRGALLTAAHELTRDAVAARYAAAFIRIVSVQHDYRQAAGAGFGAQGDHHADVVEVRQDRVGHGDHGIACSSVRASMAYTGDTCHARFPMLHWRITFRPRSVLL